MSEIQKTDREIKDLRKRLVTLRRKRESQLKVATLQIQVQKAKMEGRLPELLATPFVQELRKILIKAVENQFLRAFRESWLETIKEATTQSHPNQMVI